MAEILRGVRGFEWDKGNSGKNEKKHGVTDREAEEVFFNRPLLVARSVREATEARYSGLGKTFAGRLLTVVFTFRSNRIRMISTRPMNRKERQTYDEES